MKRYGALFTCLSIRAIHLEVTHSLDTDSFINAMRRFIARRGQPEEVRSDNVGNCVRGERELRETIVCLSVATEFKTTSLISIIA